MSRRAVGLPILAVLASLAAASPAGAYVAKLPQGRYGITPRGGQIPPGTSAKRAGILTYHGGPVMHSQKEYAVFWAPSGFSFPAGYESGVKRYLKDVAADSGRPTNVYSVGTQYTDSTGRAAYDVKFGGAIDDSHAYPTSGCSPYVGYTGDAFTTCLSDSQLQAELDAVALAHDVPRGLRTEIYLFLPDHVGSCISVDDCFDTDTGFCGYHSFFDGTGGTTIYANESFTPVDPEGCGTQQYPNGATSGVDDQLSTLSHEANESITDPLLNAWYLVNTGHENGDQCRLTITMNDFGPPLGGTDGTLFNQVINGRHYYLQQEWSNAAPGCEQRYAFTGQAKGPKRGRVGRSVQFTATAADGEGGTVERYRWSLGDGKHAGGASVSHAYKKPGTYRPIASVTNSTGLTVELAAKPVRIRR